MDGYEELQVARRGIRLINNSGNPARFPLLTTMFVIFVIALIIGSVKAMVS